MLDLQTINLSDLLSLDSGLVDLYEVPELEDLEEVEMEDLEEVEMEDLKGDYDIDDEDLMDLDYEPSLIYLL